MQLLNKLVAFDRITQDLKPVLFDEDLDSVLGYHQVTKGILVLFFSHRRNKQTAVVITGNHDLNKITTQVEELLKGLS